MEYRWTALPEVVLFVPSPRHDQRGFFSRTADAGTLAEAGVEVNDFVQDSQSRSHRGVVRGLHGRSGEGEAKLVRCSYGAVFDVVVDARPDSPTFGQWESFRLDDEDMCSIYLPPGVLHGWQALTHVADMCYRIGAEHDPAEDVTVRHDDPDLGVHWPLPVAALSDRDSSAPSWADTIPHLRQHGSRLARAL